MHKKLLLDWKKILNFGTVIILNFFPHVSDHTGLPPKTNAGLGRRAITQLEMSTAGLNTSSRRPLASARPWPQPLRMDVIKVSSTFRVDLSFQRVFFYRLAILYMNDLISLV